MRPFCMQLLLLFLGFHVPAEACRRYTFVVKETPYTRLCKTKNIMTINGQFPGPTIHVHKGETIIVDVHNKADHNITIHWHGVKLPRYPWSDGPEYITQCPIQPGNKFRQKVIFSVEEGTLWWHAHSDWTRATVHGAIVIYPEKGTHYPFPKPDAEVLILLGEWWIKDVWEVYEVALTGGDPNVSDAFTINGQPGDLYPCSRSETFKLAVEHGKTYLLRVINAAMQDILFFKVAKHTLTVVAIDSSYTKPLKADYLSISPGQTLDVLLEANQPPSCTRNSFYMAARAYSSTTGLAFDNTTTTAIVQYTTPPHCRSNTNRSSSSPSLPSLPYYNDTSASVNFTGRLRGVVDKDQPNTVPTSVTVPMKVTISINTFPCASGSSCAGPNGSRALAASMNNISFHNPDMAILEAYYRHVRGVYGHFPDNPPFEFNYTADSIPVELEVPRRGTRVKVVEYNSSVEVVFQGTNVVGSADHPMHVHGTSVYLVGWGFGNFDEDKDPLNYNLVDPPLMNTVVVPRSGWTTIRFIARNPGVWFVHCHIERHMTWGMKMAFIVKNGNTPLSRMLPPPPYMPPC